MLIEKRALLSKQISNQIICLYLNTRTWYSALVSTINRCTLSVIFLELWVRKYPTETSITTNNVLAHISEKSQGVANVRSSLIQWLKWKISLSPLFSVVLSQLGPHRVPHLVHGSVALLHTFLPCLFFIQRQMVELLIN